MNRKKVDVAVIGGGTAGLVARRTAEKEGASTLLIGREPLGTTCLKLESSLYFLHLSNAKAYGNIQFPRLGPARKSDRVKTRPQ